MNTIEQVGERIIKLLAEFEQGPEDTMRGRYNLDGAEVHKGLAEKISPDEINDAVEYLDDIGVIDRLDMLGTSPYSFGSISINSRGRRLYQQQQAQKDNGLSPNNQAETMPSRPLNRPPSPFGFTENDWAEVEALTAEGKVRVVIGYQWQSKHYDSSMLIANIQEQFRWALEQYNAKPKSGKKELVIKSLAAEYGEHLFTNMIREILAADIAIFDTSDLNPNVMLELGAALALGVTVLPIRAAQGSKPPSDATGLTWAAYHDSGSRFDEHPAHLNKLKALVGRAAQRHRA